MGLYNDENLCVTCGEEEGEHEVDTLCCPVYAKFDMTHLAGFHPGYHYEART